MAESLFYMCACKDTNLKVLKILNEIAKKEDVTDFITTVQSVQININKLILAAKAAPNVELCLNILKELCQYLKEYEAQLTDLNQANKLTRIITNSRNRKQLETHNSKINKKLEEMKEHLKEEIKDKKITRTLSTSGKIPQVIDEEDVEEAENRARLALMIEDPDAKSVWDSLFGLDRIRVEWEVFVTGIKKVVLDVKGDEEKVLMYMLDYYGTGEVSQHVFSQFLKAFGPVHDSIRNLRSIASAKWFYGFLSRLEAELLLRDQVVGTYLVRYSGSAEGNFALSYVCDNQRTVSHIKIICAKPVGYNVEEANKVLTFSTIHELLYYFAGYLERPYNSTIPFMSWFEGDTTTPETTEKLQGQEIGTFLVRFSSQQGAYTVSFVTPEGALMHTRIEHENVPDNKFRANDMIFDSLEQVLDYYKDTLRCPLSTKTSAWQVDTTKIIFAWKQEREKFTENIRSVVEKLFEQEETIEFSHQPTSEADWKDIQTRVSSMVDNLFNVVE